MAEQQTIEAPEQQTPEQQGQQPPDYTSKVYQTLKDNIDGFDKDETTFRKMITTDPLYRAKVYKTLQDNIEGFDKKPEVFDSSIGVVHRSPVKDAESTHVAGVPLPQQQQNATPAVPVSGKQGIDTVQGLLEKTGVKTADQVHAEELVGAQERIKKTWDNITPLAHKKLLSEKFTQAQDLERRASTQPGYKPGAAPALDVAPEEVEAYKADPMQQRKLIGTQIAELHKEGKTKEANQLMSDMYVTDTKDLAPGKEEKINNQVKELKQGKLRYSPLSQTLIKPTDLGESITDSWERRQKDIALFDAADSDSDADLIKKLNHEISRQDPTEPVRIPEGMAGHVGAFVGDQGPVGAVAAAVSAIPVVGEAAGAGIYGHEMARRGYAQALVRTYRALKAQGLSDADALVKAKEDAKRNMIIDAAQGIALGAATGKLGKSVKGVEPPPVTGMFQKAVTKAYDFLKEGAPSAVTQAGIANVAQQAKNASAAAAGAPHPEGEGVLEATIGAPIFHYAFGALGRGLHEAPTLMKKVLQGMTKVPEPELANIGTNLVQEGVLTPEQSTNALKQIEEHKALDAQVPDKVKNDEVRLDLQKKIKRREELEAELKTVNKAFHPEVKEKIAALDEKMNEIANGEEAKKETPEPELTVEDKKANIEKNREQEIGKIDDKTGDFSAAALRKEPITEYLKNAIEFAKQQLIKFPTEHTEFRKKSISQKEALLEKINGINEKYDNQLKKLENEQATSGERGTLPSTEKQTEPPAGSTESGSSSSGNRPEEVRSEENGALGSSGEKVTFETAKKGDIVSHGDAQVTVVGRTKSRNGTEVIEVQKAPKTEEQIKDDVYNTIARKHAKDYPKGMTVSDIEKYHSGELSNLMDDARKLESSKKATYTLDKEAWDNDVKPIKPEENAKAVRSDTGQVPETGKTAKGGEDLGGKDIQPPAEPAPVNAKTKQQAGKIKAKEELAAELKKTGLSDDEKFVLKNSFPEYKKKNPEATQDEYNVKRAEAYKKQVALRSAGMAKFGEKGEGTKPFTNTEEAVDFVKTHLADDPMAQRVMDLVQPVLKDTKIEAADFSSGMHKGHDISPEALGYSFPDKTIIINWDAHSSPQHAALTVLHEMVHNATREAINGNKAFRGELDSVLESIRRDLKLPEGSVGDALIPRLVEKGIIDADKYGGSNPHELIAEVFTNKKFQDMLRGIEYKGDNLLHRAYLAIAKYFSETYKALVGAKANISADNMADYLMQLTEKTVTGKEKPVPGEGEPLAKLDAGSEEEKQIKSILARTELPDAEIKQALLDAGHDEATVDRLMDEIKEEQAKGPEQLIREAHTQGDAAKKAAKLAPPQDTRIAKASVMKTAKRWFYDKQDEVTDVKSIIRTNKGKEEHELDMIYKASNKARDFWNTVPKEKREAFILGMERPDLQKGWTQDEKDMATVYRERLQKTFDVIKTAMPDLNFIEDYFPHFWKKPDEVKNFFASAAAKAPLEGSKGFAMKRSFDNILPGIKKGYDLVTTNPEELVRLAEANAWKFKTARSIFEDMKKLGYLKFSTAGDLPADWKGVDDKLFNRMGAYVTKEGDAQVAKGQYMMPPEVAKLMNDYLSVSGVNAPIKNVVQKYNTIKNTFQLGMGGFHFVTTSVESLINGNTTAIQKILTGKPANVASGLVDIASTATVLPNLIQRVNRGLKARSDYYKGIQTTDVANLIAVNAKVGRQKMYSLDTWYNTKKAFNAVRVDKDFSQVPKLLWNGILTIPEAINKPLMEHWVPALKVGGYLKSLESEVMARGNMNPRELQQAREKIWDSMDDRLGQVVYDNVFINKTAKDLAFMTIRSAGWTGGTIRTAIKGVGEIPLSASRLIQGKGITQRTADAASMFLTVGFFGGMYHYLMTGSAPQEMKDYFFPKDGTQNPDGTDRRITLPSYIKDYLAYGKDPLTTISHKTSPIVNDIVELISNKDFYGEKIFNKEDPIYQQGLDVLKHQAESMTPFSFKGNPKDIPRSTKQKVEQGFGMVEAPKERERSETQNAIMKAYVDQMGGMAGQAKTHEQMEQYIARRHARQYIFNGAEWDDLDDDLKEKANVKDVNKFVKEAKMDPYEFYFKSLKKAVRQQVFDAMPEDDQEKYKKYIQP